MQSSTTLNKEWQMKWTKRRSLDGFSNLGCEIVGWGFEFLNNFTTSKFYLWLQ